MSDKRSLLVVEDEILVARDIKARLVKMGYNVLDIASKGTEAVEKALTMRPDLVLMDIHLSDDMDGVEAAMKIRESYDVPVIFCTAYSNEQTLERAKISEPYGYVLKPFDNRELEINIEIALYKHRMERDLLETRHRLNATLSNINDGVIAADLSGKIYLINSAAENITGWSARKALHVHLTKLLKLEPIEAGQHALNLGDPSHLALKGKVMNPVRQYLGRPDGTYVPVEISASVIESNTSELMVITFRDISQQLRYEEELRRNAFYDRLTDLPNRALFLDRLDGSINRRRRGSEDQFAVMFLDLDGFGIINEGLGHDEGDRLITEIANRISKTVRPDDTLSRFSGDIFAVLLDPVDSVTGAIQACTRIQRAIERAFVLGAKPVHISASAGIVLDQGEYQSPEEMIRDADTALHRAKLDAKGAYVVFDNEMYKNAVRFIECKSGMQQAIADDSFEVHYQPIIDIATGKLVGMEALARWPCPDGFIAPSEFIPVAEETGLILALGEWVLRSVCRQIKRWHQFGYSDFRVAVNVSARQFDNNISGLVRQAIEDSGISPQSLTVEITEGIVMKDVEKNVRMLEELRQLGVHISIDDFGTGYSSLAYLKRFPITTLKIDRSFIKDITTNPDDLAITNAIIAMAKNLKLKVLAEGVETRAQLHLLRAAGCDLVQGFYHSEALSPRDVTSYLERERLTFPVPVDGLAAG